MSRTHGRPAKVIGTTYFKGLMPWPPWRCEISTRSRSQRADHLLPHAWLPPLARSLLRRAAAGRAWPCSGCGRFSWRCPACLVVPGLDSRSLLVWLPRARVGNLEVVGAAGPSAMEGHIKRSRLCSRRRPLIDEGGQAVGGWCEMLATIAQGSWVRRGEDAPTEGLGGRLRSFASTWMLVKAEYYLE